MKFRLLVIDDDQLVCISLKKVLEKLGYEVQICMEGGEAESFIQSFEPDVILLDIYLTSHNGLDLLREFRKKYFDIPIVMITGYSDVKIAVTAMKYGAFDFLLKPIDLEQLKMVLNKALENLSLKLEVEELHTILKGDILTPEYFGKSAKIQKLVKSAERLAGSTDTTVLIEGESGVGKEVFAKYIHQQSQRKEKAFIQINCSAIPKELAESELFGHEKGAFTGAAQKTKLGKFELADGGTILLDEVGDLSLDLQAKLLRVLQEKAFFRLGGEKEVKVNLRVLAATNKNLEDEVGSGSFREDLFYRLNVAKLNIPPLRERKEDIPVLVYRCIKEYSQKFNKEISGLDKEALTLLKNYEWKGNIRELRNVLERAILLLDEDELKAHHFDILRTGDGKKSGDDEAYVLKVPTKGVKIDIVLKDLILKTLKITNGNQVKAAKVLGLSRSKLRYRMELLGIEVKKNIE